MRIVAANFLGALGSGWILATGLQLSGIHSDAWGDSILAFLFGSSLSVFFSSYKKRLGLIVPAKVFSLAASLALIPLLVPALKTYVLFHPASLVTLLSFFFCFSFLARSERIALSARTPSLIFPVELAYALGSSISLIVVASFVGQGASLVVSAAFCAAAWLLDLGKSKFQHAPVSAIGSATKLNLLPLAIEFSSLTIATQVVCQMISQKTQNPAPLASFDIGTTAAPILCSLLGAKFLIEGRISLGKLKDIAADTIAKTTLALMLLAVTALITMRGNSMLVILPLILIASVLYEGYCLVRLEAIGQTEEGRQAIPVIFSVMAVSATITYFAFLAGNIGSVGILCLLLGLMAVRGFSSNRVREAKKKFCK